MPKTRIRGATAADFPALLDIDRDSFPVGIAYDSIELSYFMSRRGSRTLVIESDDEIAGFLIFDIRGSSKTATMITLDVLERFRRCGLAARLLEKSEEILRDHAVERYDLQVDVSNHAAISFYKKYGFETGRVMKGYYPNGNDAYQMSKRLNSAPASPQQR